VFKRKKHICEPRPIEIKTDVHLCTHEQLIPIDKRKNYVLVLKQPLSSEQMDYVLKMLKFDGYKIKLLVNGDGTEFRNA